jgi:hypothetical protein
MRRTVNLRRLPTWAQYAIAIPVSAAIMFLAWRVGRDRPAPPWIGPFLSVWMWLGPGLLAFFIVRWLWRRIRRP